MNLIFEDQTIIVGDCLDKMAELPEASIDVIVTSPPYNLGIAYRTYKDNLPRQLYLSWIDLVSSAMKRVLKPTGSIFLNVGGTNIDPWIPLDIANVFRARFVLQNDIVWVKSISIGEDTVGHFKPISSRRFLNQNHETIYHFTHEGDVSVDRLAIGVPFADKSNIKRRGHAQDKRCAGNNWFIGYETVQSKTQKFDHPASFPVALASRCIMLHGGGVVLDPFMGIGSTLVAAWEQGCSGYGIELDPVYAETAHSRLRALGPVTLP